MTLKTRLYLAAALVLVMGGAYMGRKYAQAGGASGIAFNVAGTLWDSAVNGASAIGGQLLDAMPSSQVTGVVDSNHGAVLMNSPVKDTGTLLYESALMGGG
jgi:hypothetical protein